MVGTDRAGGAIKRVCQYRVCMRQTSLTSAPAGTCLWTATVPMSSERPHGKGRAEDGGRAGREGDRRADARHSSLPAYNPSPALHSHARAMIQCLPNTTGSRRGVFKPPTSLLTSSDSFPVLLSGVLASLFHRLQAPCTSILTSSSTPIPAASH